MVLTNLTVSMLGHLYYAPHIIEFTRCWICWLSPWTRGEDAGRGRAVAREQRNKRLVRSLICTHMAPEISLRSCAHLAAKFTTKMPC